MSCPLERQVLVIYTGGTIGMIKNANGALAPVPNLLQKEIRNNAQMHDSNYIAASKQSSNSPLVLPAQKGEMRVVYWIKEFSPLLDSSNIAVDDWLHIAATIRHDYDNYDGFVVLHGTDTLAYTASALSFLFRNLGKTVVVTGSQVPIFEMSNDGLNNFLSSVTIAGHYTIPEVTVFFGDKLFRGNRTVKFCSVNCDGAFDSPNCEPLAFLHANLRVNLHQIFRPSVMQHFSMHDKMSKNVVLLRIFPGINAQIINDALKSPVEGVVLQTFGAGNIPDRRCDLIDALSAATAKGIIIVNCTQCVKGSVDAIYATQQRLVDSGVIPGYDMTAEAAFTKLSLVLANAEWDLQTKRRIMERNIRGELTPPEKTRSYDINFNTVIKNCMDISFAGEVKQIRSVFLPGAMTEAAAVGNVARCLQLEKKGADFFLTNVDYRTPLHVACSEGNLEVVELALNRGANIHAKDRWKRTPLEEAIAGKHVDIVRRLVECGAKLEDGAAAGLTFKAAGTGDLDLFKALRLAGARLDPQDSTGRTPLHVAVLRCDEACCQYLLKCGVDMTARDALAFSPLDYARMKNALPIISLFRD